MVAETLNLLRKMRGRAFALAAGRQFLTDPDLHLLALSGERMRRALAIWEGQGSGVSYTDCVVMVAADESETTMIYGFDAVFAKNGYRLPGENEQAGREAA